MKKEFKTLAELSKDGCGHYGIAASAVPYSSDLFTYLRITDINDDGTLNKEGLKSVKDDKAKEYLLCPNDIVFARTGASTGRSYFYDGKDGELVFAGFLIKFSLDSEKVNPKYVRYYCLSKQYADWVNSVNTGSTRGNINAKTFGSMPIPIISRKQQDKFVSILSVLDEKIEVNTAISRKLEEVATAIFKQRFPFISKNNGNGGCIGNYITPKKGKSLLSKDAILGNVPVIAGGLEPAAYHNVANTVSPVITISASGANSGYVRLWSIPVWSSDSSFIDGSMTNDVYFWYILLKERQKEIYDSQTGSAQPHVYPKNIAGMYLDNELNMEDVSAFTSDVKPIFEKIGVNTAENEKLSTIRDTLLPRLLSGEIDVSSLEI